MKMLLIMVLKNGKNFKKKVTSKGDVIYIMENNKIDDEFLDTSKYLFNKKIIEKIFEIFNKIELNETNFKNLNFELKNSYDNFIKDIKYLPTIMNCRVKGNSNSNFGGEECAKLVSLFRTHFEKYLSKTSETIIDSFVKKIIYKAKLDEQTAWEIEKSNREEYQKSGKDNTLLILKSNGYDFF